MLSEDKPRLKESPPRSILSVNALWFFLCWTVSCGIATRSAALAAETTNPPPALDWIRISKDRTHFVFESSGSKFTPWGFNYDHDRTNRLLETYWNAEWETVKEDFREMKQLGANTVRIHLQVARFMTSATEPNRESLDQLKRLIHLAEETELYLDITGLGCYDKTDVPLWYNPLPEAERWNVQARFWEAVARTCRDSPAVFCYDLMNEPVVSEDKKNHDWTPGAFGDRYFVQRLTLDFGWRTPKAIAKSWVNKMAGAIRRQDRRHLLTVGAIPWALTWTNAKPFFYSSEVGRNLDFVSLHFYPKQGEVAQALKALAVYDVGKPIVIEEMFPLKCSVVELDRFVEGSKGLAEGWLGFYWGTTPAEYRQQQQRSIADQMTLEWLEYFTNKSEKMR
jgi:hypothetical protein